MGCQLESKFSYSEVQAQRLVVCSDGPLISPDG